MFDGTLTAEQDRAATHAGGHLLIVAGAGTGKTTTLTARLAHLVSIGVPPERILLLTFSRRAAAELLHRAEQRAGQRVAGATWGGTFHAVANRLLRRHGRAIGLEPGFTVMDQADTADLLSLVRDELAGPSADRRRRARKDTMASILSRVVNTRKPLTEVLERDFPWCREDHEALREVFRAYTERKRAAQIVDYDDLLLFWWALLRTPSAAALLSEQVEHVLVDEYQDTNALQADILQALAAGGATITAVGDDAQAIYSFRAATVRNILDFPERFGADLVKLEQNHRSTPPLLAATNAVMAEAAERHPKTLWSARTGVTRPELVTCHDEQAQSAAVCERLLLLYDRGIPLRRQAVLFRTGHHSDLLEVELTVRNIPFVKYGGLRFLEAAHVKDLLCTLRLVENPADELAWFRVLQLLDGVGPSSARRAVAALATGGTLGDAIPVCGLPAAAVELADALADAASADLGDHPAAQVERVRRWLDPLIDARHRDGEARRADLDRLQEAAALAPNLERFLTELTLDPPSSTGDLAGPPRLDEDVLTLSTVHSAKGLEWDAVHMIHLADGSVPSDMATGNAEAIEEERRLLYVAMTRARDHLYCYVPLRFHFSKQRRNGDVHGYALRSRFLSADVTSHMDEVTASIPESAQVDLDIAAGAMADIDAELLALLD
jgi:DNA helicase-2/ATP-dependent DNA helicase PcrA